LDVDGGVVEELLALAGSALEGLLELLLLEGDPEALASAAAGGLDRDRVADRLVDDLPGVLDGVDRVRRAGDDRDAGLLHDLARAGLRAHGVDGLGRGTDEDDPVVLARLGEGGVLGEEAVAGVDGLGARVPRDLDQLVDDEVGLVRRARADQVGLVGAPRVGSVAVRLGVDGDGLDAHLLERPHDANGDLAPVGDKDLGEHGREGYWGASRREKPGARITAMTELEVRDLQPGELDEAIGVVARGMRDNPLHVAAYGSDPDRRLQCHARLTRAFFEVFTDQHPICAVSQGRIVGLTGAAPPGTCQPTAAQRMRFIPPVIVLGPRIAARLVSWMNAW